MPRKQTSESRTAPPSVIPHTPESRTRVVLDLPTSLFDLYEEQAMASGELVETFLVNRLNKTREYTSLAPLYFNDTQRAKLERILDHNITNIDVALKQIENVVTLQVGDVGVQLYPRLQQRLATRIFRGETFEGVVKREVLKGLERFVGLD